MRKPVKKAKAVALVKRDSGCQCPAPLTLKARTVLTWLKSGPKPRSEINPGISTKLVAEGYATCEPRPSPFKSHNGREIEHLRFAHEPVVDMPGYFRDSNGGLFTKCTCYDG